MTPHGRYAAPESSFGRSASTAAARGGALIAVAVIIGFLLLWQGGIGGSGTEVSVDDSSEEPNSDTTESDQDSVDGTETTPVDNTPDNGTETPGDTDTDGEPDTDQTPEQTPDETPEEPQLRAPGEVKVAVANATNTNGLAGSRSQVLSTLNYVTAPVNALNETATSQVFYVEDYAAEAAQVATELGGDASLLAAAPADPGTLISEGNVAEVDGFHIFVILGTDDALNS